METNKRSPVGVAVWGVGAHAQRTVLPALAKSPDVHLVGIHTRDDLVRGEKSTIYGCLNWAKPEQMLACEDVDVVYLATPTALHFTHGQQVLQAGKHLWCEKPLATTLSDAEQLIADANTVDRSLAVDCGPRYHPQFRTVQEQLSSGAIGKPNHMQACFHFPHLEPENFRYNPDLGGGALLDVGFYLLTLIDTLCPGKLINLDCTMSTEVGYRVDTSGRASFKFESGLTADVTWGYGGEYRNRLSVVGDQGQLTAELFFSKPKNRPPFIHVSDLKGEVQVIDFEDKNQFIEMFRAFAEGISSAERRNQLIADAGRTQWLLERAQK